MTPRLPARTSPIRTGLRFVVAVPVALALAAFLVSFPVYEGPGVGGNSLACAVMMEIEAPVNWWVFVAVYAVVAALLAAGLDRLLARWIGGQGPRSSVGLGVGLLVVIVGALSVMDVTFFC